MTVTCYYANFNYYTGSLQNVKENIQGNTNYGILTANVLGTYPINNTAGGYYYYYLGEE